MTAFGLAAGSLRGPAALDPKAAAACDSRQELHLDPLGAAAGACVWMRQATGPGGFADPRVPESGGLASVRACRQAAAGVRTPRGVRPHPAPSRVGEIVITI